MRFVSKRDWWISVLMLGISIVLITITFVSQFKIIYKTFFLLLGMLILWIYNSTFYILSEDFLILRCGPLKVKIPYENIDYIQFTKDLISSIALSTDKLKIKTKDKWFNIVYISPLNKEEFVKKLSKKCDELKILN